MKDDAGDLFQRGLWLAGGCAALGAVLILRTVGGSAVSPGAAWCILFFSLLIVPAAIDTGHDNVDLGLKGLSLGASLLGLLLFVIGWLRGEGRDELLDLGPIFAIVGLATGVTCNVMMLWDVLIELQEVAKAARDPQAAADLAAGIPLRDCPKCRKRIPANVAACRYCKSILVKQ